MHTVNTREKRAGRCVPLEPEVTVEHSVQFEPVPAARDDRALIHVQAAAFALSLEMDAIAYLEAFGIGERHLLFVPVRIGRQLRLDRWFFDEDRVEAAAGDPYVRSQVYCVTHTVCPGQYPDRP